MKYKLIAVGKVKRSFLREGCDYYKSLLNKVAGVEEIEVSEVKHSSVVEIQRGESEKLSAKTKGFIIALDEKGKRFTSKDFAEYVEKKAVQGINDMSLIIGGAEGLSEELRESADLLMSISDFTLPHELARVNLFEQLYRVETIRMNHPYHKG